MEKLDRLLDTNVFQVETSIHGADAATHDGFTRRRGSFDRLVASVHRLRTLGIPVIMKACWTKHNFRQYGAIARLVSGLDAELRGTCFIQARSDRRTDNLAVRMNDDELREFMLSVHRFHGTSREEAQALERRIHASPDAHVCGAGRVSFRIDAYGDVHPCVDLPLVAGNLTTERLEDVWHRSETMASVRRFTFKNFDMHPEGAKSGSADITPCAICMGANLKENGDMRRMSAESWRIARVMSEARREYLAGLR